MAGLSVVLEPHQNGHPGKPPAQIISKATLVIHGPKHKQVPPPPPATAASSFLHCCYLCHMELGEGRDIYMYRGDRAFCSEECRYRQIFMDVDAGSSSCGNGAGAGTTRGSRRLAGGGRVAY